MCDELLLTTMATDIRRYIGQFDETKGSASGSCLIQAGVSVASQNFAVLPFP
jgi:hypothetical protein